MSALLQLTLPATTVRALEHVTQEGIDVLFHSDWCKNHCMSKLVWLMKRIGSKKERVQVTVLIVAG